MSCERETMADELDVPNEFETLLNLLDLKQFYPNKLSRDNLYQISTESFSTQDEKKSHQAARLFINNITRYNYHARNILSNEMESTQQLTSKMGYRERARRKREQEAFAIHPLDVISAVFLCCDPTARQDLVMHLWGCKLAIPFLYRLTNDAKPRIYLWPLRCLIGQFHVDNGIIEMQLINKKMKSIAMMRVGENDQISKSYLLNCLIGGPEKSHPVFFHRNSAGSKRNKSKVAEGMIEIGWLLSTEADSGKFDGPRLFINVRGNAEHLCQQNKFIGQLATVTIVLTTVSRLVNTVDTVKDLLHYGSRVIVLLSDPKPNGKAIEEFLEEYFSRVPDTKFDIVTVEDYMLSELLATLTSNIKRQEQPNAREISLSDFIKNLSNMEYDVDESQPHYVNAFETTNGIVSIIRETDPKDRKRLILPLQGEYWKSWSQVDRDYWRFDQLDQNEKKKHKSKEELANKLRKIRNNQYHYFKKHGLSNAMTIFIASVLRYTTQERKVFLRMLKLELDNLSRKELLPLESEYQQLINETINASEENRSEINKKLSYIDELKVNISFGLEHMVREIGQLFEACECCQQEAKIDIVKHVSQNIHYTELPKLACFLMIDGYPVEIVDGEACSVPLLWVKSVLDNLPSVLQESGVSSYQEHQIKVHVVSVLGIQSSGKSTFLNTIFGLQFAVSAGRCTRGVFMQGVKVDPSMKGNIGADYLLAIDTEGLRAAELVSDDSRKHDNELSTFVIGLADITVINLMGENATYLQENLPIAVHAFLRMKLAGLHPRCSIVHHNVDKRNKEKLLVQGRILESILNKLTNKACELEKIPHRLFQDIIEFSISRHTDYIPALYEGEQPMAPVSVGYSKEAENVRKKIFEFVDTEIESSSLSYFARHIEKLWIAIKTDRFVYEFRTTLEVEARLQLDQKSSAILMDYLTKLDKVVDKLMPKLTSKKLKCEEIERQILTSMSVVQVKCTDELEHFITKPKRRVGSCYEQWKDKCLSNLEHEIDHHRNSAIQQLKDRNNHLHLPIHADTFEMFFDTLRRQSMSLNKSEAECFDVVWEKWAKSNLIRKDISVVRDTAKALQDVCPSHKHLLAESMIKNKSINEFTPSVKKHLNHFFHKFSEKNIGDLFEMMSSIKESVKQEYTVELNTIKLKKMPYSDRYPRQILLKVGDHLSGRLKNEDNDNEIANQFKIDLLICIAGNIVKDFEKLVASDSILSDIKQTMEGVHSKKITSTNAAAVELVKIISDVTTHKLKSEFPTFVSSCVIYALKTSNIRNRIASKTALFGYCLQHVILNDKDEMLSVYVYSPKRAVYLYLQIILGRVITNELFVPALEDIIKHTLHQIKAAIEQETTEDITFMETVERILTCAELDESIDQLERYKVRTYQNHKVNTFLVKESLKRDSEQVIKELTEIFKQEIFDQQDAIVSFCAETLCTQLIGCENVCPFCNEICKYSSLHANISKHECFIHRPVGCKSYYIEGTNELSFETCTQHYELNSLFNHSGVYIPFKQFENIYPGWLLESVNQEQPSLIWKWILVNKYSVLRKSRCLKLPKDLPESWTKISRNEVLLLIKEQFRLP